MEYYAGIDVSLEASHICVVDAQGKILKEAKVLSEPDALIAWFVAYGAPMTRISESYLRGFCPTLFSNAHDQELFTLSRLEWFGARP